MTLIGYARVSKLEQDNQLQLRGVRKGGGREVGLDSITEGHAHRMRPVEQGI